VFQSNQRFSGLNARRNPSHEQQRPLTAGARSGMLRMLGGVRPRSRDGLRQSNKDCRRWTTWDTWTAETL